MEWLRALTDWAAANGALLWWLFGVSLALILITPLIVAGLIVQMPVDYFVNKDRRPLESWGKFPLVRWPLLIAKNLLGLVLLLAGIIMLFTPGQGLLTIVVGVVLIDFPGKFHLERWLAMRQSVWRSINWMRKRVGRPDLRHPAE